MIARVANGDLVVFRTASEAGVARVDLVRDRHVTAFPWRQADRRWDRRRFRLDRGNLLAVLPEGTDPAPIADQFNVLRNQRDAERAAARTMFEQRVDRLAFSLASAS